MRLRNWNSKSLKLMMEKLRYRKCGCSCVYVKLSVMSGVKLYTNRRTRDFAYNEQMRAYGVKLGPMVGQTFEITDPLVLKRLVNTEVLAHYACDSLGFRTRFPLKKVYGYITQHVRVVDIGNRKEKNLLDCLRLNNFDTFDVYAGHNTGLINKRAVCFDFDPMTMGAGELE
jgi:hypothetical protein